MDKPLDPESDMDYTSLRNKMMSTTELVSEFLTTGGILGEMALLTNKSYHVFVECETSVQVIDMRKLEWKASI